MTLLLNESMLVLHGMFNKKYVLRYMKECMNRQLVQLCSFVDLDINTPFVHLGILTTMIHVYDTVRV